MLIKELWRYPVKSMAGEQLDTAEITEHGIAGDRIIQVRNATGRIFSARTRPELLRHQAVLPPNGDVLVDGRPWNAREVAIDIERAAGAGTRLVRSDADDRFDVLPLLVTTDGMFDAVGYDPRRFRPNLVIAGEPLCQLLKSSAGGVVLEITEHVDVQDYPALRRAFVALGGEVRFAVDDAGAGFASLRHILELAPSHVKLDRALVARIDDDPARQALVTGLVHFAREIDVMLIAEGVETAAERDTLLKLGVHVGQGYFFGRPAPAAEAQIAAPGRTRGTSAK